MQKTKKFRKDLRKRRVRAKISGSHTCPRLSVFRGAKTCYLQLINDVSGQTLASASERELSAAQKKAAKSDRARTLGNILAEKAKKLGITAVVFDRGGNAYHGRVAAIADGAREGGLQF